MAPPAGPVHWRYGTMKVGRKIGNLVTLGSVVEDDRVEV